MKIQKANKRHYLEILKLLADSNLPTEDVDIDAIDFQVGLNNNKVIAGGAVQSFGDNLLLRSVAVHSTQRGKRIGAQLVEKLVQDFGRKPIYLLTESTTGFFEQLGFIVIKRGEVPEGVQKSTQFSKICPASANPNYSRMDAKWRSIYLNILSLNFLVNNPG
ncbi:MAG: GNAT family N-acetyltransferase [Balneolaceae bacterium]|nr:GNAT family N-acetyltransferase [Balneolaceae bacterium]